MHTLTWNDVCRWVGLCVRTRTCPCLHTCQAASLRGLIPVHVEYGAGRGHQLRPLWVQLQQATAHSLALLLARKHPAQALWAHRGWRKKHAMRITCVPMCVRTYLCVCAFACAQSASLEACASLREDAGMGMGAH